MLRDGENAFLVEPGDPAALRDGLRRGLADPTAADMARHAREEVEQLTWTKRARRILDFLHDSAKVRSSVALEAH